MYRPNQSYDKMLEISFDVCTHVNYLRYSFEQLKSTLELCTRCGFPQTYIIVSSRNGRAEIFVILVLSVYHSLS